jgi:uncharacterized protein
MDAGTVLLVLVGTAIAFTLSASAGLGGSLVLIPVLALVLGTKEGVALAALLLAGNNVVKVLAYRRTMPVRKSLVVVILVIVGSAVGASLLVAAPEGVVSLAVVASLGLGLLAERLGLDRTRLGGVPVLAFASGATSGFSGSSGPLKGVALRCLSLDRRHLVGAASLVSMAGDATKAGIYTDAGLLSGDSYVLMAALVPVMVACTFAGRSINGTLGERGYSVLFWGVMGGYTMRLLGLM